MIGEGVNSLADVLTKAVNLRGCSLRYYHGKVSLLECRLQKCLDCLGVANGQDDLPDAQ